MNIYLAHDDTSFFNSVLDSLCVFYCVLWSLRDIRNWWTEAGSDADLFQFCLQFAFQKLKRRVEIGNLNIERKAELNQIHRLPSLKLT